MFDITGKVALVTGGASGIGFEIVKELFRNGLGGCTIADVNQKFGDDAIRTINEEFGPNKIIFVKTDVVDKEQFQAAFEATVKQFHHVDILVNNAGILNDVTWEREIQINVQGVINGILLGMENYLQKHRSGSESVILNVASIVAIDGFLSLPVYTATKHAVLGLTKTFGGEQHHDRTKVKVIAICPGITDTPLIAREVMPHVVLSPDYRALFLHDIQDAPRQAPECVGKAAAFIIKNGDSKSAWVAEAGEPPYELSFPKRRQMRKVQAK